jgi:V8-like Glu-specific endopeptidase
VFKTGADRVDGVIDEENRTRGSDFRPSPSDWKMQFRWPRIPGNWYSYRCTATMIEPQVAITAAHCVRSFEAGWKAWDDGRLKVRIAGQNRTIRDIRVPECWDYSA